MTQDDILTRLRANEASLKARGVIHAALFGSRARGQGRPTATPISWSNWNPA